MADPAQNSHQTNRRLQAVTSTAEREALLEQLARSAAAGDSEAAGYLAAAIRNYGLARPALREYLFKDHDVDAAEGAVLIAVAYKIGSFRGESKFRTWLYSVAKNEAKQFLRSEQRHTKRASAEPIEEHDEHFVAHVSSMIIDQAAIAQEIALLQDDYQEALLLREEQGLSYEEVAAQLGVPLSTAKTRVRRARLALAQQLSTHFRRSS